MFHQSRSNYYNVVENDRDLTEDYRVLGEGAGRGREGGGADCLQNTGSKDISGDRIIRAGAGRKEKAGVKLELKRGQ